MNKLSRAGLAAILATGAQAVKGGVWAAGSLGHQMGALWLTAAYLMAAIRRQMYKM